MAVNDGDDLLESTPHPNASFLRRSALKSERRSLEPAVFFAGTLFGRGFEGNQQKKPSHPFGGTNSNVNLSARWCLFFRQRRELSVQCGADVLVETLEGQTLGISWPGHGHGQGMETAAFVSTDGCNCDVDV